MFQEVYEIGRELCMRSEDATAHHEWCDRKLGVCVATTGVGRRCREGTNFDGVYSYPEASFRASNCYVPGYDVPSSHSATDLTSSLSFLGMKTKSGTGNSETTNFKSNKLKNV